jgi:hypothetical protein
MSWMLALYCFDACAVPHVWPNSALKRCLAHAFLIPVGIYLIVLLILGRI